MSLLWVSATFDEDHETPLEHFGIRPVSAADETHYRKGHEWHDVNEVRDVPVSQLRAGQRYVDTARVHDIARNGLNDPRESESAPPQGVQIPNGQYMLTDGHHRAVGNILRGEQSMKVHVRGAYGRGWENCGCEKS